MRNIFTFTILSLVAFLLVSCGPTSEQAKIYNNKIVDEQVSVVDKYNTFITHINDTPAVYHRDLKSLQDQLTTSTKNLKGMDKFDEKTEFADACIQLYTVFEGVSKNELSEVISLYDKEDYNTDDQARATELFKTSDKKVQDGLDKFTQFQKDFAAKYHFTLEEPKP